MSGFRAAVLVGVWTAVAFAQNPSERFYQAIRNNDLPALEQLIGQHTANISDTRRQTALMNAAAFGSYDAVKLLIDAGADVKAANTSGLTALHLCAGDLRKVRLLLEKGADVNARSGMGRTALLVAAYTHGASDTVNLLLGKGAEINVADSSGVTPLIAATKVNDAATARILIDRGADVTAQANTGQAATALMAAAHNGNAELMRLLLARKAPVNVVSSAGSGLVKNGTVQFGSITPLHAAALSGNPEVAKLLLEAGARVDATDMRGTTPLMWSVSTDRPTPEIVRMLLEKGADTALASTNGETALDWARKFNNPAVLSQFKLAVAAKPAAEPPVKRAPITAREAAQRSMPLLQAAGVRMLDDGGCIACHAQPMVQMAVRVAGDRGWMLDKTVASTSLETLKRRWMAADQLLLQGEEAGGSPDTQIYGATALAAIGEPASSSTDVLVHYLLAKQRSAGNWHGGGSSRAPIQDGDFSRTAMSIRVLTVYGMPARRSEIDQHVERATSWLVSTSPQSTEDRVMQLLGLKWGNSASPVKEARMRELIAQQDAGGGWAQTPFLFPDAYATGQVLYALHELGLPSTAAVFQRGVDYLLRTQREDGSWYVKSRAMKIQPYFESGFPHGHDQWISAAATAWAAIALSYSAPERTVNW
jgi:ankyrin repeat protein